MRRAVARKRGREVEQQSARWMAVNHVSHTLMLDIFIFNSSLRRTLFFLFFLNLFYSSLLALLLLRF